MRTALLVLPLAVAALLPLTAFAEEPAEAPHASAAYVPGIRLYFGGANGRSDSGNVGSGGVLGFESFIGRGGVLNGFWGIEILGVQVGNGNSFVPFLTGDFGGRLMPWPDGIVRPYLKGGFGVTLVLIIPVPSLTLSLGLAVPIGQSFQIDVDLGVRRAFNIFNVADSVNIGTLEIGIGF